jgi:hypothetical protein
MIVFASHNNTNLLDLQLERLCELNLNGHDVLFVDTVSTDKTYIRYFNEMKQKYLQFTFVRTENMCWDTGAYLHAYRNYKRERYIFLQDSLYITSDTFFVDMDRMLDEYDVVPIFDFYFDIKEHTKEWITDGLPVNSFPQYGYFGPIFGVNRSTLDKIPPEWHRIPHDKVTATHMERRWALMFHLIGAKQRYFNRINYGHFWSQFPCTQRHIRKIWLNRLTTLDF